MHNSGQETSGQRPSAGCTWRSRSSRRAIRLRPEPLSPKACPSWYPWGTTSPRPPSSGPRPTWNPATDGSPGRTLSTGAASRCWATARFPRGPGAWPACRSGRRSRDGPWPIGSSEGRAGSGSSRTWSNEGRRRPRAHPPEGERLRWDGAEGPWGETLRMQVPAGATRPGRSGAPVSGFGPGGRLGSYPVRRVGRRVEHPAGDPAGPAIQESRTWRRRMAALTAESHATADAPPALREHASRTRRPTSRRL